MNARRRILPALELTVIVPVIVLTLIGSPTLLYIAQTIVAR
jgi:hypothetical protein